MLKMYGLKLLPDINQFWSTAKVKLTIPTVTMLCINFLMDKNSNHHHQANLVVLVLQQVEMDLYSVKSQQVVDLMVVVVHQKHNQNNQQVALQLPMLPVVLQLKTPRDALHLTLLDSNYS